MSGQTPPHLFGALQIESIGFTQLSVELGEGVPQPGGALEEPGHVVDLAGKEMLQELVLHNKDGGAVLGQFSRERTFPAAILPQRKMSVAEVFMLSSGAERLRQSASQSRPPRLDVRVSPDDVCGLYVYLTRPQIYPELWSEVPKDRRRCG